VPGVVGVPGVPGVTGVTGVTGVAGVTSVAGVSGLFGVVAVIVYEGGMGLTRIGHVKERARPFRVIAARSPRSPILDTVQRPYCLSSGRYARACSCPMDRPVPGSRDWGGRTASGAP
jgi:hypothetical protein